jgi:TfoX/Sxy family transcriptional regulator of competence genes
MPYNEQAAEALRAAAASLPLNPHDLLTEKKMFGGLAILVNGSMIGGLIKDQFVIRLNDAEMLVAHDLPGTAPMDFNGKPLRNYIYLEFAQASDAESLLPWLTKGLEYVREHPPVKRVKRSPR